MLQYDNFHLHTQSECIFSNYFSSAITFCVEKILSFCKRLFWKFNITAMQMKQLTNENAESEYT